MLRKAHPLTRSEWTFAQEFDTEVLLLPPAPSVGLGPDGPGNRSASAEAAPPKIVELPDESDKPAAPAAEEVDPSVRDKYHLVLFHADYSKKSRELQMTVSRLSNL
ncbi:MAG: hypothetical protein LBE44_01135 [Microbacterium hominis]|nr:hypothetical protein [Microbacterium hominis]